MNSEIRCKAGAKSARLAVDSGYVVTHSSFTHFQIRSPFADGDAQIRVRPGRSQGNGAVCKTSPSL